MILPDSKYAEVFYRSVFWLYCPPGWAAQAFISLGNSEKAKNILEAFYKPQQLNENARITFPSEETEIKTEEDNFGLCTYLNRNTEAWYYGHELMINRKIESVY